MKERRKLNNNNKSLSLQLPIRKLNSQLLMKRLSNLLLKMKEVNNRQLEDNRTEITKGEIATIMMKKDHLCDFID